MPEALPALVPANVIDPLPQQRTVPSPLTTHDAPLNAARGPKGRRPNSLGDRGPASSNGVCNSAAMSTEKTIERFEPMSFGLNLRGLSICLMSSLDLSARTSLRASFILVVPPLFLALSAISAIAV